MAHNLAESSRLQLEARGLRDTEGHKQPRSPTKAGGRQLEEIVLDMPKDGDTKHTLLRIFEPQLDTGQSRQQDPLQAFPKWV